MHVYLYVLCPLPLYWISRYLDGTLIVHPNVGWRINCDTKSQRIPCNQTHYVAALIAALYSASVDESEMVCFFLIYHKMGPSTSIKIKLEVDFMSVGSPAQSESENPGS